MEEETEGKEKRKKGKGTKGVLTQSGSSMSL